MHVPRNGLMTGGRGAGSAGNGRVSYCFTQIANFWAGRSSASV